MDNISTMTNEGMTPCVCPYIFLCDVSGSMYGQAISIINFNLVNIGTTLSNINENELRIKNVEVRMAILTFAKEAKIVYGDGGLKRPEDYESKRLYADGYTSMGSAFDLLNKILSKDSSKGGILPKGYGLYAPIIILLSDGLTTDSIKEPLEELEKNRWFNKATRISIAYGNDCDEGILRQFCSKGEKGELFWKTLDVQVLSRLINEVTIASTQTSIDGKTSFASPADQQKAKIDLIRQEVNRRIGNNTILPLPDHSQDHNKRNDS